MIGFVFEDVNGNLRLRVKEKSEKSNGYQLQQED